MSIRCPSHDPDPHKHNPLLQKNDASANASSGGTRQVVLKSSDEKFQYTVDIFEEGILSILQSVPYAFVSVSFYARGFCFGVVLCTVI
jgi:hypothetical protein